ncbi:MAG: Ig-like domain-containing protein, partial [Anaerolineae bacterium]
NSLSPGSLTTWSALGSGLNGNVEDLVFDSSTLYAGGWFSQSGATTTRRLASWNGSSWQEWLGGVSGTNAIAQSIALDSDGITVAGQFTQAGALAVSVSNITRWANSYRYHDATNTWEAWTPPATLFAYQLNSPLTVSDGAGNLYIAAGAGRTEFYRYNMAGNTWTARASLPAGATPGANAAFTWANGAGYLLTGSGLNFYRYTASSNTWAQMANAPLALGAGAALTWDEGNYLYAQGGGNAFWRYDISANSWQTLAAPNVGGSAGVGAGLAARGNQLFGTVGAGAASFRRYGPVGLSVTKVTLDKVALVAPATAATATWTNLTSPTANNDFQIATGNSRWVAGAGATWTPSAPSVLTVAQAQFLDVPANLYRVGASSTLTAGYYDYQAPVTVTASATPCTGCYTSLQAAILSGAQRVLLEPGVYQEPAWLVSGVQVLGAGAETTILQPTTQAKAGQVTSTALLSGEGISSATVARLTLNGDSSADGARFEDGAANVLITRNIVRGAGTALSFDGAGTNVEVVNNTLVANDNGLQAANCADVDVRNTIFVSQGVALSYQTCASTELHQYNDYYGNSQDYVINGTPVNQPGAGEIAADPLFTNPLTHNYRPLPESPVIDTGNPSDPAPPGAGGRADMGYVEYGAAGFYVDDDYCATCLNDGLTWQVDAFAVIQDALDALAAYVEAVGAPLDGQITVGVANGTYQEEVILPSYANLVCESHQAVITPSIIVADAVNAGISHCTITSDNYEGAASILVTGTSPDVQIWRNIIGSSVVAVVVEGNSSASIQFNSFGARSSAISLSGNSWATVENNIMELFGAARSGPEDVANLLSAAGQSRMSTDFNLLRINPPSATASYYDGNITIGANDAAGVDPLLGPDGSPTANSPAVDTADPRVQAPPGGGRLADRGAVELRATPLALLFGRLAPSCTEGNSGVASTEVGLAPFSDFTTPLTATLPSAWVNAPLLTPGQTASYWNASVPPPAGDGYYRVFTRAADVAGNAESDVNDWFSGVIQVDGSAPAVSWIRGADTTEAAMLVVASTPADDAVASGFQVDSQFYPAQRLIGAGPDYTFYAWVPALNGSYQVTAQVTDRAGNTGASAPRTINVTTPAHVATIASVLDDGASNSLNLALSGYARFTDTSGSGQVYVSVNAGAPIMADVTDPAALLTTWSTQVTLPGSGLQTLQVTASRTTQLAKRAPVVGDQAAVESPDNAITILVDQIAPGLTISRPAPGAVVTQTVMLEGTVSDASSGVDRVEFSVDGGLTWQDAQINGNAWSAVWISPVDQPFVSYPLTVRVFDQAGNVASLSRSFTVDLGPPNGFYPLSFNYPVGSHLDTFTSLQVSWQPVFDTSNLVTVTVAIDQNSAATPTTVVNGTSFSRALDVPGDWYVHIKASDAAANNLSSDHGPWRVGTFADTAVTCTARTQTIALDGLIDLTNQEWKVAAELLDTD